MNTRSTNGISLKMATPKLNTLSAFQWLLRLPPSYIVLAGLLIVIGIFASNLLSPLFTSIILRQCAPLGIIVLGQALVMRAGSIDLSVVGVSAMTIYLVTSGILSGLHPAFTILIPLVMGILVGAVNGVLIAYVRASAVMTTLGVTTVLLGLVSWMTAGQPPGAVPRWLNLVTSERLFGLSYAVYIWVGLTLVFAGALRYLVFGKLLAAIGDSPKAAAISGLPVKRVICVSHIAASLLGAMGALLQTSALGVGSIKPGLDLAMNAIAAAILGAVTFGSGRGGVLGPFVAVLAFGYLFAALTVFGVQEPGRLIVQGIVIAVAAISAGIRQK
ncbi:ABC transporter permease [Pseudomonas sp. USTB-Z]|uniref:ABC transporter permease n=1 Tax=Pseudomonas sp. USTB-Z TaxID=2794351 RepID=UPI001C831E6A|nr:ABC transporter permease [Pseudomonas sp. USTB-Z]MBX6689213.1 ABC transporter permease [Pseudomonas sp. USTB-Z]